MFVVGPESAGAHPGPVCYKKGGPLTVTDANLALGRLLPEYFPNIFGPNEDSPLDKEKTILEFQKLTLEINCFLKNQGTKKVSNKSKISLILLLSVLFFRKKCHLKKLLSVLLRLLTKLCVDRLGH